MVGNLWIGGRGVVTGDISANGRLLVAGNLVVAGDGSFQSRLFLGGDAALNARLFVGNDISMGGNISIGGIISTKRITENIFTIVTSTASSLDYNVSSVYYFIPAPSANFTASIINIPTLVGQVYTLTFIMDTSQYTTYCSGLSVNGSAMSNFFFSGGSAAISLTGSTKIIQTISIFNTPNGTPDFVLTNVIPYMS
jgi:hypothetical protein